MEITNVYGEIDIKSNAHIRKWVENHQNGKAFENYRGRWVKKYFSNLDEKEQDLRAQVKYL
ncbi:hypothetical protein [Brevibacillus panacihumi]|uniref:hypothetical protein n=1 Tax=Brevibacillus panacihumi TaxID=497735 RepID=UPI003D226B6F